MTWAQRRKMTYILIVVTFFAIVAFAIYHKITSVVPTCFDHKKNGVETGIDCGGGCTAYCANELNNPVVEWVRVFPVTPGVVEAVAYIQHGYPASAAQTVGYEFKLYDDQGVVLADRTGTTFLATAGTTAIVEALIPIDRTKTVSVARFTFTGIIPWKKVSPTFSQVIINTDRRAIESFTTPGLALPGTRLTATLQNKSRVSFTDLDVVAIFYDKDGNAITASKVLLPALPALQNKTVYFTWPYPVNNIARTEIIPRYNPFTSQPL